MFKGSKDSVCWAIWFLKAHSADLVITHLVDQIYEFFEKNDYTFGVFNDLSKAFHTFDYSIPLKKLRL